MLPQLRFVAAVEAQTAQDGNCGDGELENCDPEMREVNAVGLSTVLPQCECDNSADPYDDAGGNELKDTIPYALYRCQRASSYNAEVMWDLDTFSHAGPLVWRAPLLLAPAPKRSSKPSGCDNT